MNRTIGVHFPEVYGTVIFIDSGNNPIMSMWRMYLRRRFEDTRHWIRADNSLVYDVGSENVVSWARISFSDNMVSVVGPAGYTHYDYTENPHIISLAPAVTGTIPHVLGALGVVLAVLALVIYRMGCLL